MQKNKFRTTNQKMGEGRHRFVQTHTHIWTSAHCILKFWISSVQATNLILLKWKCLQTLLKKIQVQTGTHPAHRATSSHLYVPLLTFFLLLLTDWET